MYRSLIFGLELEFKMASIFDKLSDVVFATSGIYRYL